VSELLRWTVILSVSVIVGLAITGLGILCLSLSRKRRQARFLAELSAKYKPVRAESEEAGQPITVDELVTRIEAEGLSVRLNWEQAAGDNEPDWPTGILPTMEPEE